MNILNCGKQIWIILFLQDRADSLQSRKKLTTWSDRVQWRGYYNAIAKSHFYIVLVPWSFEIICPHKLITFSYTQVYGDKSFWEQNVHAPRQLSINVCYDLQCSYCVMSHHNNNSQWFCFILVSKEKKISRLWFSIHLFKTTLHCVLSKLMYYTAHNSDILYIVGRLYCGSTFPRYRAGAAMPFGCLTLGEKKDYNNPSEVTDKYDLGQIVKSWVPNMLSFYLVYKHS